jgi:hypothetical protein
MTSRRLLPVLGVLGIALVLSACNRTTYGTGVGTGRQTIDDISNMFALGGKKREAIDYTPRAGVVKPPTTASLPKPGSAPVEDSGDWPKDPDEADRARKAAALAAADKRDPVTAAGYNQGYDLPKVARKKADPKEKDSAAELAEYESLRKNAKKIFSSATELPRDENGKVIRQTLTEPPSDYRDPDPTAPQEFGGKKKKKKKWWQWGGGTQDSPAPDTTTTSNESVGSRF